MSNEPKQRSKIDDELPVKPKAPVALLDDLLTSWSPDDPVLSSAEDSCALQEGCPVNSCAGKGYILTAEGSTIQAKLCPCVLDCPECVGQGFTHNLSSGRSQFCIPIPPQKIVALYSDSHLPRRYLHASLDGEKGGFRNFSGNADRVLTQLKDYVASFPSKFLPQKSLSYDPKGLILSGPVGVGKTFLLVSLAKKFIAKGYQVKFVDFFRLIAEIQGGLSNKESPIRILDPLIDVEILLIDELGKGRNSEFESTILDQIIMGRYNQNKPIIATTNYSLTQPSYQKSVNLKSSHNSFSPDYFGSLKDRVGSRIFSRLFESCRMVALQGNDYRKMIQNTPHHDV
ncbi:MAG: ATP-binding protein [Proteobacteria bacterium]|nr:ATP-binding protein [Pseudomonadota bacterium]